MKAKTISDNGLQLIKDFEGFSKIVYMDSANLPTIGYGTLIDEENEQWLLTAVIDEATATQLLKIDVKKTESTINSLVYSDITQNQFDALCSLVYNIGIGAFAKSTILNKVNINPNNPLIHDQFLKWCYVDKITNTGLLKRRNKESILYFTK